MVAAVLQICLHYGDLYDLRKMADRRDLLIGLLRSMGAASALLAIAYYWIPDLMLGRGVVALATLLIVALVIGWRISFEWLSLRGQPAERLLIVGTSSAAISLARELFERRSELGVELVGFIDPDPATVGAETFHPGVIGTVSDIPAIVRARRVDRVVVSLANARGKLNMDELLAMKLNLGVRFDHLASVYEQYTGKIAVENLRPSWMIFGDGFRKSATLEAVKRSSDVGLAVIGLVLAAPAMGLVWLALRFGKNGSGHLQPDARGQGRGQLHDSQVPLDAGRCRGRQRRRLVDAERSAGDARRPIPAADTAGRAAAVVERAAR